MNIIVIMNTFIIVLKACNAYNDSVCKSSKKAQFIAIASFFRYFWLTLIFWVHFHEMGCALWYVPYVTRNIKDLINPSFCQCILQITTLIFIVFKNHWPYTRILAILLGHHGYWKYTYYTSLYTLHHDDRREPTNNEIVFQQLKERSTIIVEHPLYMLRSKR